MQNLVKIVYNAENDNSSGNDTVEHELLLLRLEHQFRLRGTVVQFCSGSSLICHQPVVLSYRLSSYGRRRRAFSVAGPTTWNSLPRHLRHHVHTTSVICTFTQDILYSALGDVFGVEALYKLTFCFALLYLNVLCRQKWVGGNASRHQELSGGICPGGKYLAPRQRQTCLCPRII